MTPAASSRWTRRKQGPVVRLTRSARSTLEMRPSRWRIAFGLMVVQSGLPWWVAPALSIAGFAGSLELLLIGMMLTATPLAVIALTTFLVNFRHVFYAF